MRLGEVLSRYQTTDFKWGESDCFTLCVDTANAILGEDRFRKRKKYDSLAGGAKQLRDLKFKDIGDAFASVFREIPPSLAQRGDIGRARYAGAEKGGGVVFIGHEVLGKGERGLVRLPVTAVERAFRVI